MHLATLVLSFHLCKVHADSAMPKETAHQPDWDFLPVPMAPIPTRQSRGSLFQLTIIHPLFHHHPRSYNSEYLDMMKTHLASNALPTCTDVHLEMYN